MDPSRCVVLVPVGHHIEPPCEEGLRGLESRGYEVRRVYGFSAIDQARSQIATDALADGFDELMWIDSDMSFDPDMVEMLRADDLPVVSGVYVKKNRRALTCSVLPGTEKFVLGAEGGIVEVRYAPTGFLHTRREVYEKIAEELPVCNRKFGHPTVPYFLPMVIPHEEDDTEHWYLAEDLAFSERARRCGFDIYVDTRFRLGHIGRYSYTWEDAGSEKRRFANYTYNFR